MHAVNACNSNINFNLTTTALLTVACISSLHVKLVGAEEHNTTDGIHVYDGVCVLS